MKKKTLAIIPARYESSRFPGKPLAKIHGKTLIQHTFENAFNSHLFDSIIVATDDLRIFDHVTSFGGSVIMTSPHCKTGTDRIAEVIQSSEIYKSFDTIVNLQGDEPCIESSVIESVIESLNSCKNKTMSTAVMKLRSWKEAEDRSIVKCVFDQTNHALYFSRNMIPSCKTVDLQDKTDYYRHLGIYAFTYDFLLKYASLSDTPLQKQEDLEQLKVLEHGYKIKIAIVNSLSIGVDTLEDIKKVETLLWKQNLSL